MLNHKFFGWAVVVVVVALSVATVYGAETTKSPKPSATRSPKPAPNISCVTSAIGTRELALQKALTTHSQAMQNAYSARAAALANAYTKTSNKDIKTGLKSAWDAFKTNTRTAAKDWKLIQKDTWSAFRESVKNCGANGDIMDLGNSGSEISGN
jgi:hypothetical protein